MKKWISVSAMAMVMAFATVALSAQAKQAPPAKAEPKKEAPKEPKKEEPKKESMKPACAAGEHLKDAKKPKSKDNPCVKG